jgi:hypothetical protein
MDHASWSMVQDIITERNNMNTQTKQDERTEERKNRFTGESIMLTPAEAIKHDEIFYYEYLATLEDKKVGVDGHSKFGIKCVRVLITLDSTMLRLTWFC